MMMVGVNPVADALGRVNKLEVIPLEELGRPRIDVVVNCSGVFRDLFVNQVGGIDVFRDRFVNQVGFLRVPRPLCQPGGRNGVQCFAINCS